MPFSPSGKKRVMPVLTFGQWISMPISDASATKSGSFSKLPISDEICAHMYSTG